MSIQEQIQCIVPDGCQVNYCGSGSGDYHEGGGFHIGIKLGITDTPYQGNINIGGGGGAMMSYDITALNI